MGLNDFVKAVQVMKPARQYIFALKRLEIFLAGKKLAFDKRCKFF